MWLCPSQLIERYKGSHRWQNHYGGKGAVLGIAPTPTQLPQNWQRHTHTSWDLNPHKYLPPSPAHREIDKHTTHQYPPPPPNRERQTHNPHSPTDRHTTHQYPPPPPTQRQTHKPPVPPPPPQHTHNPSVPRLLNTETHKPSLPPPPPNTERETQTHNP